MEKLYFIKKEKNIIFLAIFIGTIISVILTNITKSYSYNIQKNISNEVIRFHVLANSDEYYDQALKRKVKDGIIEMLQNELTESLSKDETRIILIQNLDKIEKRAKEIIIESGYDYDTSAKISYENFPTKKYGSVTLPAGEYEALKIEIGEAKGKNWWCVMFPPLCFVDIAVKEVPEKDKEILKSVLTDEEYDLVMNTQDDKNISLKIKFKIVELWQGKKIKRYKNIKI